METRLVGMKAEIEQEQLCPLYEKNWRMKKDNSEVLFGLTEYNMQHVFLIGITPTPEHANVKGIHH